MFGRWGKKRNVKDGFSLKAEQLPVHIGIIMDGNGRWAKKRGQPRSAGHVAGARTFRAIAKHCEKRGIRYLTVYAFSTENWARPAEEVGSLMRLLKDHLVESLSDFTKENIRTRFIGDVSQFSAETIELIRKAEDATADKTGMTLNIAVNYGGRHEITAACRRLAKQAQKGALQPGDITEEMISAHLDTAGQPDPDLILRPSGEHRISNFMIWQAAYAEFVYMNTLWPDFTPDDLDAALLEYAQRSRRFGGV